VEILSSYIKEVSVGDVLTIQALITNPLDWQHFYEKLSSIKKGERTDFTVVTREGDRLVGYGDVNEMEKWSDNGRFGFKIKIEVGKQKSLTDRRIRGPGKTKALLVEDSQLRKPQLLAQQLISNATSKTRRSSITYDDMSAFKELLKDSLSMDIPSTTPRSSAAQSSA